MMFNTGDLGYENILSLLQKVTIINRGWSPDGDLKHLGKVNHQVQVNVSHLLCNKSSTCQSPLQGFHVELDGVAIAMEVRQLCSPCQFVVVDTNRRPLRV